MTNSLHAVCSLADVPTLRTCVQRGELRILVQAGLKKRSEAEVEAMERTVVELIARACHLDRVDARAKFKLFQARTGQTMLIIGYCYGSMQISCS